MGKLFEQMAAREWFVDALAGVILVTLILLLILAAMHMLGKHLHDFFHFLGKEAKDFIQMRPTLGAINFLMVMLLLLFGVLVIVAIESQKVLGFIASYIGTTKVDIFAKSVDLNTLFYVLAAVIVVSVLSVAVKTRTSKEEG